MEMLMFSGLEAQSEINRLLDEIYGGLDSTSLDQATRRSRTPETHQSHERHRTMYGPSAVGRRSPDNQRTRFDPSREKARIRKAKRITRPQVRTQGRGF
jgi:hypothetical protein